MSLWALVVYNVWKTRGLFDWLGLDFALYSAGARLLFSGNPAAVYDLASVRWEMLPYTAYYGAAADPIKVGPLPHPAVTFLLYAPFLPFRPPIGFLLWAVCNFALATHVVRALTARVPGRSWPLTGLILSYFPLMYALFVGQPVIVLLFAFLRAYRSWEEGRDFEAGLWCGVLFLKVQYPFILILVLLYKRRWRSLAGFAASGLFVALTSLAAFGVRGVVAHLATIRSMSGFRSGHPLIAPEQMINWRGLLLNTLPASVPGHAGSALTLVLSAFTAATLLVIWRGRWEPASPRFASRMLATLLVTMLVGFHSHSHGATLLLVPGIALFAHGAGPRPVPFLLGAGLYAPTILFALTYNTILLSLLFIALMAATLAAIFVSELGFPLQPCGATRLDGPGSGSERTASPTC
ncbi:MAG: glycosyltransferase family 87 protein [Singulisphaera sp.]